ncbi:hypothetical protein HU200_006434 [Digitaria exilis]|uniref:Uncharacterized protein n=1 Tax=Digitaria exilis TaxID=1010633 RepID=A0A835FS95_9POAL|nr:hypothetical protein HU200_006434 [Digitaria exilis]
MWELLHGIRVLAADGVDLRPLLFESGTYEVLLRMGKRMVVLDVRRGGLERTAREARLDASVVCPADEDEKIEPWCRAASTLLLSFGSDHFGCLYGCSVRLL